MVNKNVSCAIESCGNYCDYLPLAKLDLPYKYALGFTYYDFKSLSTSKKYSLNLIFFLHTKANHQFL